jgi:hypothetical protein
VSITYADLKTAIAVALRDPSNQTFDAATVGSLANRGLAEVGRVLPDMFQEDITPVADQLAYVLRSGTFSGALVPEIEVARVELWDGSTTPATQRAVLPAAADQPQGDTEAGWANWGGTLTIPRRYAVALEGHEADWYFRVWGYSPYAELANDNDVANVSTDAKFAVIAYAKVEALDLLVSDRNLFTQWQTRSGNSDMSPAGLMNELNFAREDWRRKSRALLRLRARV